jgi:UDP-N-acetylmuramate dehydrogenase
MTIEALPQDVQRDQPLARFATVRTGGSAELFARVGTVQRLVELLGWARERELAVHVVGSGSNLLIADAGVAGLVLKLDGEHTQVRFEGTHVHAGGAVRLPSLAARCAREGLAGFEFGVNIPGTIGGAVRMNAGAYDGELARVLVYAEIATAEGVERRDGDALVLHYRSSALAAGEVVAGAELALSADAPQAVLERIAAMRERRHAAQPQGIRTFGSTFKNPEDPRAGGRSAGLLLAQAGCNGLAVGGARFSPKHANFIENTGSASTADVLAVMDAGRQRVLEQVGVALEPEVQTLGEIKFPWQPG